MLALLFTIYILTTNRNSLFENAGYPFIFVCYLIFFDRPSIALLYAKLFFNRSDF